MQDRLQTQLFGPYFGSFSAHSYGYELSNDPKSVLKLLDFRFGPVVGQTPSCFVFRFFSTSLSLYGKDIR